jgi:hypothetical protein
MQQLNTNLHALFFTTRSHIGGILGGGRKYIVIFSKNYSVAKSKRGKKIAFCKIVNFFICYKINRIYTVKWNVWAGVYKLQVSAPRQKNNGLHELHCLQFMTLRTGLERLLFYQK